jgi:hypothetical protein
MHFRSSLISCLNFSLKSWVNLCLTSLKDDVYLLVLKETENSFKDHLKWLKSQDFLKTFFMESSTEVDETFLEETRLTESSPWRNKFLVKSLKWRMNIWSTAAMNLWLLESNSSRNFFRIWVDVEEIHINKKSNKNHCEIRPENRKLKNDNGEKELVMKSSWTTAWSLTESRIYGQQNDRKKIM